MSGHPHVVVFGSTGFVGPAILRALEGRARVTAGGRQLCDVSDDAQVIECLAALQPDAVVNAVAANPGSDEGQMAAVNTVGAVHVAAACAASGIRLVHISTDVLHDGTAAPYADDAPPSPLHAYGSTKAAGERGVLEIHQRAVAVRSSLVWDPDRIDRPTAGFMARLEAGAPLSLWTDVLRQPIHADDLARILVALALDHVDVTGTLNAGGSQVLSRHGFGTRLLRHFGAARAAEVEVGTAPPGVPTDLRLKTDGLRALRLHARGVDEVLTAQ